MPRDARGGSMGEVRVPGVGSGDPGVRGPGVRGSRVRDPGWSQGIQGWVRGSRGGSGNLGVGQGI